MSGMMTKVWGPGCWVFLHCLVHGYPDKIDPNNKEDVSRKKHTKIFLENFPYILPCKYCRKSCIKFVEELPSLEKALDSKKELCKWMYKLHNKVNIKLGISDFPSFKDVCSQYDSYKAKCSMDKKGCIDAPKGYRTKRCKLDIEPVYTSIYENSEKIANMSDDKLLSKRHELFEPITIPITEEMKQNIIKIVTQALAIDHQELLEEVDDFLELLNFEDVQGVTKGVTKGGTKGVTKGGTKGGAKEEWRIYGQEQCPYCREAKKFAEDQGLDYEYYELTDHHKQKLYKKLGASTIPMIFKIKKNKKYRYIGGLDKFREIKR